ncbi:MAG: glutamine-hydrolyzing carbamoyl-phosphate synthase small subunit [Thalassobaculum sp.]|uniref:glutamine-hydrolyzing carbamoyl-phosphate synthase small subunit n=1 Tax=Thalassobaculum sp. TaxID=2022740 RepID=UPI0032EB5EB0
MSDPSAPATPPPGATGALVLSDGTVFWGRGFGAAVTRVGEVCFNTSMSGYQEILTDPSYAGQIITFTFPHIGNVGANPNDLESTTPASLGCVLRADVTDPSNYRSQRHLDDWLKSVDLPGLSGIDTRRLTRRIRDLGAPVGVLCHAPDGRIDVAALQAMAADWPGLEGMDLAKTVSCTQTYAWDETLWEFADDGRSDRFGTLAEPRFHVVAVDYGAKRNILRNLASQGCRVTVVPASSTADVILGHNPDGVFLANGPGDPAATGVYAVPELRRLVDSGKPLFGICLGHQMLALALGAKTEKMHMGHRGANHPVKDLETGKVEITSQNHGFVIAEGSLPDGVTVTHRSLFDGSIEGLKVDGKPVFSVQYHPEASPGPMDSHYLFARFRELMERNA